MQQIAILRDSGDSTDTDAVRGVRGRNPLHQGERTPSFCWKVERGARRNYRLLGRRLAEANSHLYRQGANGHGLIQVLATGAPRLITKAAQLAPILVDSMTLRVTKEGKIVGELPAAMHLNAMLASEAFLGQFPPVDRVALKPLYLRDFTLVQPGYQDDPDEGFLLYLGKEPTISDSCDTVKRFLDVMDFASNADQTNAVAAALTVLLRNHWLGAKPVVVVTATKSHAGKGTIVDFIRGNVPKADLLYEGIDWPMQSQLQRQHAWNPDIGLVSLDNIRLDSSGGRGRYIRSALLESFLTSPEIHLASPGAGEPARLKNRFVMAITTNDGMLSADLLNRALPVQLAPKGDVQTRQSPIGNPKLEFLPANQERIEAELRGMVERWKGCGRPLDETVQHPMTPWARTMGGILKANGFTDFLGNYATCRTQEDPVREALAILASAAPGQDKRPSEWADLAVQEGLAKTLFSPNERDTRKGRERGIGVRLSKYRDEILEVRTPTKALRVRLEGGFRRWSKGKNPSTRYVFTVLEAKPISVEE
jgi:hypothetical protein